MTAQETKNKTESKRLARLLLPDVQGDSALLPPDRWVIATVRDLYKKSQNLKRDTARGAALVASAIGATGVIGAASYAALTAGAALLTVVAAAATGLILSGIGAYLAGKKLVARFQKDTLPEIVSVVKSNYLKLKSDEMKRAWKQRMADKKREKEAQKTASMTAAPLLENPKQEEKPKEEKPREENSKTPLKLSGLFKKTPSAKTQDAPNDRTSTPSPKSVKPGK